MKRLKLFVFLFSITVGVSLWWYCSTRRCSDESLSQVESGMRFEEVTKLLGPPVNEANNEIEHWLIGAGSRGTTWTSFGFNIKPKNIFAPCLKASMSSGVRVDEEQVDHYWLGHQKVLWLVINEKGVVYNRYVLEISEADSPAIAWIKEQISKWK